MFTASMFAAERREGEHRRPYSGLKCVSVNTIFKHVSTTVILTKTHKVQNYGSTLFFSLLCSVWFSMTVTDDFGCYAI